MLHHYVCMIKDSHYHDPVSYIIANSLVSNTKFSVFYPMIICTSYRHFLVHYEWEQEHNIRWGDVIQKQVTQVFARTTNLF